MLSDQYILNVQVMDDGLIVIPEKIRNILGLSEGDFVSFIVNEKSVRLVNTAVYAVQALQEEMLQEAALADITSDEDIIKLVKEIRNEKS